MVVSSSPMRYTVRPICLSSYPIFSQDTNQIRPFETGPSRRIIIIMFPFSQKMAHHPIDDSLPASPDSSTSRRDHGLMDSQITSSGENAMLQDNNTSSASAGTKRLVAVSIESTKCILCLASFKSAEELRAHIRIVHARSERNKRRTVKKENVSNNPEDDQDTKPEKAPTPLTR